MIHTTAPLSHARLPKANTDATTGPGPFCQVFQPDPVSHQSHASMPTTLMGYDALTGLRLTDTFAWPMFTTYFGAGAAFFPAFLKRLRMDTGALGNSR